MKILNYGSLNVDLVYRVPHISRPGETLASASRDVFAGGKGLNQSVALGRAGADVAHAGRTGEDGAWLVDKLGQAGVDTQSVVVGDSPSGHAVIQVDESGQNSIVLFAGQNMKQRREDIDATLRRFPENTILLLQNEINDIGHLIEEGSRRGFRVCFNPAPFADDVPGLPLASVDILVLNETEATGLTGQERPQAALDRLTTAYPCCQVVLTLGEEGVLFGCGGERLRVPAVQARVVDTTAAGDTFIGYFLAAQAEDRPIRDALETAVAAAALCVSRPGACDSIPIRTEVAGVAASPKAAE